MGELFWNKIAGAVLATFLTVFALTEVSHMLIHPHELEEPAYPIDVPEAGGTVGEPEIVDVGLLLSEASVASGENLAGTLCGSCHSFNEGGPPSTGPNLWEVVGRTAGTFEGFGYSNALVEYGQEWTYENLWAYLERPSGEVPGTAMTFAGLRRENQRADIVAYLGSLSDDPRPYPDPLPEIVESVAEELAGEASEIADDAGEAAEAVDAALEDAEAALDDAASAIEDAADDVVEPTP